jgi:glycine dehydrogenase subunit 1
MLRAIGVSSLDELFSTIPREFRMEGELRVPGPLSEPELDRHMRRLASRNRTTDDVVSFLGGGVYDHSVPSVVRHVTGMPQFYTAYTPYQAEASQGTLQSIYEFQSLVCGLTGLDVANASMYDGASAAAEACLMAIGITRRRKVLVARSANPALRSVSSTYLAASDVEIVEVPFTSSGVTDASALHDALDDAAVFVVQHPNFFGLTEPVDELSSLCEAAGTLLVASVDPLSLAVLKPPSEYGAAIAVGEGQSLGSPVSYGGPLLGFMAAGRKHIRRMPGRIIGETVDADGRRGYVMTLQTREQHIRREKATSNICTNQGLLALRASAYLAALGPQGLRETAQLCLRKAHYAADRISQVAGVSPRFDRPFFKEFTVKVPGDVPALLSRLDGAGYHAGLALGRWYPHLADCMSVAVTERRARQEIDGLAAAMEKHC